VCYGSALKRSLFVSYLPDAATHNMTFTIDSSLFGCTIGSDTMWTYYFVAIIIVAFGTPVLAYASDLATFKNCISATGQGDVCVLDPKPDLTPYVVGNGPGADTGTLYVARPVYATATGATLKRQSQQSGYYPDPLIEVEITSYNGTARLYADLNWFHVRRQWK
jgi:hypothetical protein